MSDILVFEVSEEPFRGFNVFYGINLGVVSTVAFFRLVKPSIPFSVSFSSHYSASAKLGNYSSRPCHLLRIQSCHLHRNHINS